MYLFYYKVDTVTTIYYIGTLRLFAYGHDDNVAGLRYRKPLLLSACTSYVVVEQNRCRRN